MRYVTVYAPPAVGRAGWLLLVLEVVWGGGGWLERACGANIFVSDLHVYYSPYSRWLSLQIVTTLPVAF